MHMYKVVFNMHRKSLQRTNATLSLAIPHGGKAEIGTRIREFPTLCHILLMDLSFCNNYHHF
jgi:undecaprenyl pyrophosphate synthase